MKLCFIDVETTGLDDKANTIWQLAGQLHTPKGIEKFEYKVKPFEGALLSEYALKMNHLTPDILNSFDEEAIVYNSFIRMLNKYVDKYNKVDKFFFIGYNATFDERFVRALFERQGNKYFGSYFWYPPIDVMTLACYILRNQREKLTNFKLATVCRYLKIPIDEASLHDAQYDIDLTVKLYQIFERYEEKPKPHVIGE